MTQRPKYKRFNHKTPKIKQRESFMTLFLEMIQDIQIQAKETKKTVELHQIEMILLRKRNRVTRQPMN